MNKIYQNRSFFINRGISVKEFSYVENINIDFR
jgi:hypothetical protein